MWLKSRLPGGLLIALILGALLFYVALDREDYLIEGTEGKWT